MTGEAPRELATTRALEALPSGAWRELYEVRFGSRHLTNVDHVVVGRPGVFVIDSRDWSGQVEIDSQALVQDGYTREATLTRLADAAAHVAALVPGLDPSHVTPVLCFDHDEPVSAWVGDVLVCTTASLVDLLVARHRVMDAGQVDDLFTRVTWALPSVTYRVGEPPGSVARRTPSRRASSPEADPAQGLPRQARAVHPEPAHDPLGARRAHRPRVLPGDDAGRRVRSVAGGCVTAGVGCERASASARV